MKADSLQQYLKLRRELTDERGRIQARLRQINDALGELQEVTTATNSKSEAPAKAQNRGARGKRTMSPEARARIAAAQRARWAAQKGTAKSAPSDSASASAKPKRKMSAAGRKAIAEAARKRWAAAKAEGKSRL